MVALSSPIKDLKNHYSVIVIGSGYGGAIAASRLARAGQQVCLLERGKEFQVGEYPNTEIETLANLQITGLERNIGSRTGLYDIHYNKEISAFIGCGLGGTSLVNANVALRAEARIFEDSCWPSDLRDDHDSLLEKSYKLAEEMLKPVSYPEHFPLLTKLQALEKSAMALNGSFYRPPICVNFIEGINHVGIEQHPCKLCGDCVSGCNYAAKNTLMMNYLPDAKNFGAEIFTKISVQSLERQNKHWVVYYQILSSDKNASQQIHFLTADLVVLAAGTLGSTEILLRSKAKGLVLSECVGEHFSGNGDVLAFGYNNQNPINGIGFNDHSPEDRLPVGPCITGIIDLRNRPNLEEGIVIEEGSIPGGVATFLPKILALSARLVGSNTAKTQVLDQAERELDSLIGGAFQGATLHTQTYLVMSHDGAKGTMFLDNDKLRISWPSIGSQSVFATINTFLQKATEPLQGIFIPNPIWSKATEHTLVTVHPMGGCIMADSALNGVVNHKGQVFCATTGAEVYDNLYVSDGSIIPRSLGVNPLLTISALAERCCALIAKDRSWKIEYSLPSVPKEVNMIRKVGLEFTETMRGFLSFTFLEDYLRAYEDKSCSAQFTLTIIVEDLQEMLVKSDHSAKITGTVSIPFLSKHPLNVVIGKFNLFVVDENHIETRKMIYQMSLVSVEGNNYSFEGFKLIHNEPGFDVWEDTTTLYVDIYDESKKHTLCAKGILKILPPDFMHQLKTMKILNASNPIEILKAQIQFGKFFVGVLYQTYGGVFAKTSLFQPDAPPRQKRNLCVAAPEIHYFTTQDKQDLRLTRYHGGGKGPVILAHGLGVSSLIFSIDTIEVNLLEFLFAHGYDVWLLDYRASIDLPASNLFFSADEIALYDYPAAVAKVLEITQKENLQIVAHCFGATTLCMAMLAGLQGVRSICFSQVAAHITSPPATEIKAGLYIPSLLDKIGLDSLTAYTSTDANWQEMLLDTSLKFISSALKEKCQSAVCHRISFLYGPLFTHSQINSTTHDHLHEMFGLANIKAFQHLALMIRKGHVVNNLGEETYLPHLDRLALPITFIHGSENQCFLPASTAMTYQKLQQENGASFYKRYVIPNYGHIDCIFGKEAFEDVYPYVLNHLEAT